MRFSNSLRSAATPASFFLLSAASLLILVAASTPPNPVGFSGQAPARYVVMDLGTNFFPVAINTNGVIAGNSSTGPAIWSQGLITPLANSASGGCHATALNNLNQVVGRGLFMVTDGSINHVVEHACSWSSPSALVTDLDTFRSPSVQSTILNEGGGYSSIAYAVSDSGVVYGCYEASDTHQAVQFSSTANPVPVTPQWDPFYPPARAFPSGWGGEILSAAGSHWCGNYNNVVVNPNFTNGFIVDSSIIPVSTNLFCHAYAINTNGVAVGAESTIPPGGYLDPRSDTVAANVTPVIIQGGSPTNLPGFGAAVAINNYFTTDTNGVTTPTPQVVGTDVTGTNAALWDYTAYNGTNTTSYVQKNLAAMLFQPPSNPPQPPAWWTLTSVVGINDAGMIAGMANYNQIPYAPVAHGVLLLPCQFFLLNGDTNTADVDGVFFDGHRPAAYTDPDISSDNVLTSSDTLSVGTNLGPVNPDVGMGAYADSYVYNLLVAARVSNIPLIKYACTRTFQDRVWAMQWDGSLWQVRQFSLGVTGFPNDPVGDGPGLNGMGPLDPTDGGTTNVSPKGILYYADSPGIPCVDAATEINEGDCVYRETRFTYTMTITIGSKSASGTFMIGEKLKLTKINTYSDNDPRDFSDPTKNYISVSSSDIPTCWMTTTKAAAVVGSTRPYISLTNNVNSGDQ